jgi:methyl-accepting chemotaxis protein
MTNSSSASKVNRLLWAASACAAAEAVAALVLGQWWLVLLPLAAVAVLAVAGRAVGRLAGLVDQCIDVLSKATKGDLNVRVVNPGEHGDLNRLPRFINRVLDLSEAFSKEANTAMQYANKRKYFRQIITTGLRGDFVKFAGTINRSLALMEQRDRDFVEFADLKVKAVADAVSHASSGLQGSAETMSEQASESSTQAMSAAAGAEQAAVNVQAVAAAVEEFSASINEITQQVTRAANIASEAAQAASRTDATVRGLSEAADKIGAVVKLISDIAAQTNLLALNATIEAARAGDAGKGFAVVANEVKNLANQTARATEDIALQVAQMQSVSNDAIDAIRQISGIVGEIEQASSAVAGAVEEQGAVTQEIARNVSEAANGTAAVSSAIAVVQIAAGETSHAAGGVAASAATLSHQSEALRAHVEEFVARIRRA